VGRRTSGDINAILASKFEKSEDKNGGPPSKDKYATARVDVELQAVNRDTRNEEELGSPGDKDRYPLGLATAQLFNTETSNASEPRAPGAAKSSGQPRKSKKERMMHRKSVN
jgi:hypothetical protein